MLKCYRFCPTIPVSTYGRGCSKDSRGGADAMTTKRQLPFDPKVFLSHVGDGRSIGKYKVGQIVFSQGDPADAVFYIQRGKVKITVVSEQGKEAVIAILGKNEFFGEGFLIGQSVRVSTVAAMSDSIISRLDKTAI